MYSSSSSFSLLFIFFSTIYSLILFSICVSFQDCSGTFPTPRLCSLSAKTPPPMEPPPPPQPIMVAATSPTSTSTTPFRDAPFKVIIVGAGVGGLTLAHCLDRAGVDYVVVDKHPVAPAWGGSISIHPSSSRVLDQLGILDALEDKCTPMHNFWNRDPSGKNYLSGPFFDQIKTR